MTPRLILIAAFLLPIGPVAAVRAPDAAEASRREAAQAAAAARRLEAQAASAHDAATRARAEADALVARIEAAEAGISAADARLALLWNRHRAAEVRLAEHEQPAAELIAALAAMARRPAALALVQPGGLTEVARTRATLDATLPAVRQRSAALHAELLALAAIEAEIEEARAEQTASRAALAQERLALAALETREIERSRTLAGAALGESNRALSLREESTLLLSVAERREQEERAAASLARLPGPVSRPDRPHRRRLARPVYRLPVAGPLIAGMGEVSPAGIHSRGLTVSPAPDIEAVAPAGGRVAFAGAFRSYGEIVIIDHGGGWTSLVTGLGTLGVEAGERVAIGQPIGRSGRGPVTVELRRAGRPYPIAPLIAIG